MEVQILSSKLIKASAPTPPQKVDLSFIDQLAPSVQVGCILYYPIDPNVIDRKAESAKMLIQLQKSLSETLTVFYPLAGRYNKEELCFEGNNEGAVFWEARVPNVELAEIVHGRPEAELLTHFVPQNIGLVDRSDTPLLAIQVNVFKCGGLAIGVLISHKIADAFTRGAFVDAWAKVSRGAMAEEIIHPNFGHLASLIPAKASSPDELKSFLPVPGLKKIKTVLRRFVFDGAAITSLKAKVGGHVSRVEAVSALMWKALIGASRAKHGHLRASLLCHTVNLRGRTSLPETENACGNFYMFATARFRPNESKLELHDLAILVGDAIRNALASSAKTLPGDDGLSLIVTESFREARGNLCNEDVDMYKFTSWCRTPYYKADFGWGKPAWVSEFSVPVVRIGLTDTKCGNGIEAWLNLEEQDVFYVQQDEDIVAFCS